MTTLNLLAKQDFLEREANSRDPIRAISELVWNALDADATKVEVVFERNALGGMAGIRVIDNGHGIDDERANHDFGNLGDSWKRQKHRTVGLSRAIHGKEGRGRLKFFALAQRAKWNTTFKTPEGALQSIIIEINAKSLERCEVSEISPSTSAMTGTTVELKPLKDTFDWLGSTDAFRQFSTLFAPYVLQYPNAEIWFNTYQVDPNVTIHRWVDLPHKSVPLVDRTLDDLKIKVIE